MVREHKAMYGTVSRGYRLKPGETYVFPWGPTKASDMPADVRSAFGLDDDDSTYDRMIYDGPRKKSPLEQMLESIGNTLAALAGLFGLSAPKLLYDGYNRYEDQKAQDLMDRVNEAAVESSEQVVSELWNNIQEGNVSGAAADIVAGPWYMLERMHDATVGTPEDSAFNRDWIPIGWRGPGGVQIEGKLPNPLRVRPPTATELANEVHIGPNLGPYTNPFREYEAQIKLEPWARKYAEGTKLHYWASRFDRLNWTDLLPFENRATKFLARRMPWKGPLKYKARLGKVAWGLRGANYAHHAGVTPAHVHAYESTGGYLDRLGVSRENVVRRFFSTFFEPPSSSYLDYEYEWPEDSGIRALWNFFKPELKEYYDEYLKPYLGDGGADKNAVTQTLTRGGNQGIDGETPEVQNWGLRRELPGGAALDDKYLNPQSQQLLDRLQLTIVPPESSTPQMDPTTTTLLAFAKPNSDVPVTGRGPGGRPFFDPAPTPPALDPPAPPPPPTPAPFEFVDDLNRVPGRIGGPPADPPTLTPQQLITMLAGSQLPTNPTIPRPLPNASSAITTDLHPAVSGPPRPLALPTPQPVPTPQPTTVPNTTLPSYVPPPTTLPEPTPPIQIREGMAPDLSGIDTSVSDVATVWDNYFPPTGEVGPVTDTALVPYEPMSVGPAIESTAATSTLGAKTFSGKGLLDADYGKAVGAAMNAYAAYQAVQTVKTGVELLDANNKGRVNDMDTAEWFTGVGVGAATSTVSAYTVGATAFAYCLPAGAWTFGLAPVFCAAVAGGATAAGAGKINEAVFGYAKRHNIQGVRDYYKEMRERGERQTQEQMDRTGIGRGHAVPTGHHAWQEHDRQWWAERDYQLGLTELGLRPNRSQFAEGGKYYAPPDVDVPEWAHNSIHWAAEQNNEESPYTAWELNPAILNPT